MRTLGIDLASAPKNTGVCVLAWGQGEAVVEDLRVGAEDDELLAFHKGADVTGIDAPFGWPVPFVELLADRSLRQEKPWTEKTKQELRFRLTDARVHELTGQWPLSVSTDLIGVPALRCAGLLTRMGVTDRSGDGRVYETYPSVALKVWGLQSRGYKGPKNVGVLRSLYQEFVRQASWLRVETPAFLDLLTTRDDAFDALIAALIARAASRGLTTPPSPSELQPAQVEGWIHVPLEESFMALVD